MSNLYDILHDQPATLPAPVQPRPHKRHNYTGWMNTHPAAGSPEHEPDALRDLLGHEYFDPEPAAPRAKQVVPEGMHQIGDLARALGKSSRTIRLWIEKGWLPDAPVRTRGPAYLGGLGMLNTNAKRLWPAEEINVIVEIAQDEGVTGDFHKIMENTNFVLRVHDAIREIRAGYPAPSSRTRA